MSQIETLIAELCPDGVTYVPLSAVADVGTGSSNRNESTGQGSYPFYVRSKTVYLTDEFEFDEEAIIIPGEGGIGEIFHFASGKYALHQRAYRIHIHASELYTKFVLFYMKSNFKKFILTKAVSATVTSIRKPMILDFKVPVPPLEVQQEIVRILDTFTELETELEAELEARKKQYEHYRNALLKFGDEHVQWLPMGDVCTIKTGQSVSKELISLNPGVYPVINSGRDPLGFINTFNTVDDPIGITSRGAGVGSITWQRGEYFRGNLNYSATIKDTTRLSQDYLFHVLNFLQPEIQRLCTYQGIPALNKENLEKLGIPVVSLQDQEKIAATLTVFSEFTAGALSGLPAEIAARRKQYEYYRAKLLTFKELVA